MAEKLLGKAVAEKILAQVKEEVAAFDAPPKLVVVMVGNNPASAVYVRHKEKACAKVGIRFEIKRFEESVTEEELLAGVEELNADPDVNGFIVQLPLPAGVSVPKVIKAIDPVKDVDGFQAYNVGKVVRGVEFEDLAPCTPKGVIEILDYYDVDVSGMDAVVVGRSDIVGKPMAMMLINRSATVTVCHSKTKDLARYTRQADLVVVAVGRAGFLTGDMVKEGAVVVDVGINRLDDGSLCGDVDADSVETVASALTPVPGGVGPMTVACLMRNTLRAAKKQLALRS